MPVSEKPEAPDWPTEDEAAADIEEAWAAMAAEWEADAPGDYEEMGACPTCGRRGCYCDPADFIDEPPF